MTTSFSSVRPMTTAALSSTNSCPAKFDDTTTRRAGASCCPEIGGGEVGVIGVCTVGCMSSIDAGAAPFSFMNGVVFCSAISDAGAADGIAGAVAPVCWTLPVVAPVAVALSSLRASW